MVILRKILACLLIYGLVPLGLPTANAADETSFGREATTNSDVTRLMVKFDSPNSYSHPAIQHTLAGNGSTLLPSAEMKYDRRGFDLTSNTTDTVAVGSANHEVNLLEVAKLESFYNSPRAINTGESRHFRVSGGLGSDFRNASAWGTYPQDTSQAPQQQPSPEQKSRVGKVLAIVGIALMGEGGAVIALAPDMADPDCDESCWRGIGGISVAAGAILAAIGISKW